MSRWKRRDMVMETPATELDISTSNDPAGEDRSVVSADATISPLTSPSVSWVIWSSLGTSVAMQPHVHCDLAGPVEREQRALQAHLVLLHGLEGWDRYAGAVHHHPQLTSEPDD